MDDDDVNAPVGGAPQLPGETIAREMPSIDASEQAPAEEPASDSAPELEQVEKPAAKPAATAKPEMDWRDKRRIEETNKRRAAEQRNATLEAELARLRQPAAPGGTTNGTGQAAAPQVTPVQDVRAEVRREMQIEQQQRDFQEATGRVLEAGLREIPDFETARQDMIANFGEELNNRPDFFHGITAMDNGHKVFHHLAKDPDLTQRLLRMPTVKMAMELAKLGDKLDAPVTPAPKPISKVPAPVKPVTGAPQSSGRLDDEGMDMKSWANQYLKDMAKKGK